MPTLADNKKLWDGEYDWASRGDEWSAAWGNPSMQWHGTILPRIKDRVPAGTIVEIACGYGRWTSYLKDLCEKLIVIDLSTECIEFCKRRFSNCSNIEYFVNDGRSLGVVQDRSVDFVFSCDSLVHVDESVMRAYVGEIGRILKDDGSAFIHHSNLGEYRGRRFLYEHVRTVRKLGGLLVKLGLLDNDIHARDWSVDAKAVQDMARESGLVCLSQEVTPWVDSRMFIDCMSILARRGGPTKVFRNVDFNREARNLRNLSRIY